MPVPLDGPELERPIGVAIVPSPFGDEAPEVVEAVKSAGRWLADAGYAVEEIAPPRLADAADVWHRVVINEERRVLAPLIRKFGDAKSRYNVECHIAYAPMLDGDQVLACFEQRLAIVRAWQLFRSAIRSSSFRFRRSCRSGLDRIRKAKKSCGLCWTLSVLCS